MAGEERILEMVCRDISCYLLIQILETQDELGDGFMGSLFDSVELAKQFAYGDLTVEKFQKLRADILEGGKLPRVASRIPSCGGAIEVKCKFGDFGRIDLCGSKPLRRMVGLPCVEEGADVGFGIWAVCIADVGVIRHGIEIYFV